MSVRPIDPMGYEGEVVMSRGTRGTIDLALKLYTTGHSDVETEVEYSVLESPGFRLVSGRSQSVTVPGVSTEAAPHDAGHEVQIVYEGTREPPPPAVQILATVTVPGTEIESETVAAVGIRWTIGGGT